MTVVLGPKRGENPLIMGSLLFAIQRYNIFRRKQNRFNISQQSRNVKKDAICTSGGFEMFYDEAVKFRPHFGRFAPFVSRFYERTQSPRSGPHLWPPRFGTAFGR